MTADVGGAAQKLYDERWDRLQAAIALEVPDRVPISFNGLSFFPAKYAGISFEDLMYDSQKLFDAYRRTIVDFEPDFYLNPGGAFSLPGDALEALRCTLLRWPGGGLPPDRPFQFVEGEYMRADEYDHILSDPSDFVLRRYLPRAFGALSSFENAPSVKTMMMGWSGGPIMGLLATPEFEAAFAALAKASRTVVDRQQESAEFHAQMRGHGFPCFPSIGVVCPFDLVSDWLRGMRGTMLDMYRRPEKLIALTKMLEPTLIEMVVERAKTSGDQGIFIALHRGSDGFLSPQQFETFYWPGLQRMLLEFIDNGLTPVPFFEGNHTSRLGYYATLPKGKILGLFDATDPRAAKDALRDTMCISGMMPPSLLQMGTPDAIRDYARQLIDYVGDGGGYVMGPTSALDEADPERVKLWVDFTKEYGVYR